MKKFKIIEELIKFKNPDYKFKYLTKAEEELGFDFLLTLIQEIYRWQKTLYKPKKNSTNNEYDYANGTYTINHENILKGFQSFFEVCPKLSEVFMLEDNILSYQKSVNEKDRIQIMKLMDERLTIIRRVTRRRPWRD